MSMIVHAGGVNVESLEEFRGLDDPTPLTDSHYPIRHDYFFDLCKAALVPKGWQIETEEYALHRDEKNDNAFALWGLRSSDLEHSRVLGARNSNTKAFSAQLGAGQRVTVCDNLLFSAAVVVGRKHTKNIKFDLPRLMANAMSRVGDEFVNQERRTEAYKEAPLDRTDVHHVMMECVRSKAIPPSQLMQWIQEWDAPSHEEFEPRTAWSLQNSFTEVAKRWTHRAMEERTSRFVGVMDTVVEVELVKTDLTEGVEDAAVTSDNL